MRQPKLIDYILLVLLSLIWASAFFNINFKDIQKITNGKVEDIIE